MNIDTLQQDNSERVARQLQREERHAEREARIHEQRVEQQAARENEVVERFAALEAEITDLRKDVTVNKGELTKLRNTVNALKPA